MCSFQPEKEKGRGRERLPNISNNAHNHFHVWPLAEIILATPFLPLEECQLCCRVISKDVAGLRQLGATQRWVGPPGRWEEARQLEKSVYSTPLHTTCSSYICLCFENVFWRPSVTLAGWTFRRNWISVELKRPDDLYSAAVRRTIHHFSHFSSKNVKRFVSSASQMWEFALSWS